jgi:hypothetical protein
MEKIITSILGAFLPFIVTYLSTRNKANVRKNLIDEAQKKVSFIDSYYNVMTKLLPETEIKTLKDQLSEELGDVKNDISLLHQSDKETGFHKLHTIQQVFLTFKPLSFIGWICVLLFYIDLIFICFGFIGVLMDEQGNFSIDALAKNSDAIIGMVVFVIILILIRWVAVLNYKKESSKIQKALA